jgi:biofilm protein TabA
MKKIFILPIILIFISPLFMQLGAQTSSSEAWNKKNAKKWVKKMDWKNGLKLNPHETVNDVEFARQYHINKEYWDKAFAFLRDQDLKTIEKGRYPIDGENVCAIVTEDPSKNFDKTNWESHRKYIDLQSVIEGEEKIGVYPVSKARVTKEYDESKDIANYTADGKLYSAKPGTFFLFFPTDAHRPNITPGGNLVVKKIVIKIKAAE